MTNKKTIIRNIPQSKSSLPLNTNSRQTLPTLPKSSTRTPSKIISISHHPKPPQKHILPSVSSLRTYLRSKPSISEQFSQRSRHYSDRIDREISSSNRKPITDRLKFVAGTEADKYRRKKLESVLNEKWADYGNGFS